MQGTGVQFLVQEDSICFGAAKPVHHNYWAQALVKPECIRAHAQQQEKSPQGEAHVLQLERSHLPQLEKSPHKAKTQHSQK